MTAQAPNPREFKSWEDAFQYPVPVVRRLEQQLRGNINENSDKLRTLVGTSYRDLLSTAERIIEMDEQMHKAEDLLGEIGQKCNARAIERIANNHARNVKSQRDRNSRRNALASTLSLLQNCLTMGSRIIKRGGSSLLAAKLLVLARLLHSSASKLPDPPPLLDTLRTRLVSLRRRVLDHVDKILEDSKVERNDLIETLSAFSLATTSTPTDVLRHFLNTRGEALNDLLEEPTEAGVHSAMSLLLSTLKDAQTVFPRRLADLLARLQDEPLLRGDAVRGTPELNLDVFERWIAEDVRNFTPYLRHDQLQASQATKIIQSWAATAKKTLLEGLEKLLGNMTDAPKVMSLRKDVILRSLSADRKLPGLDQASFFEDLRNCFIDGLRKIAIKTAHDLTAVIEKTLVDDVSVAATATSLDLWDPMNAEMDVSKGAVDFRSLVVNYSQGKDGRLQSLDKSMSQWSTHMAGLSATIKGMEEDRWDDNLDLDLEDDLDLDSPQDLLTKADPTTLNNLLLEQKNTALSNVYARIQSSISETTDTSNQPAFLLRLLRAILQHSSSTSAPTAHPPQSLLSTLYTHLANRVFIQSSVYRKSAKHIPFSHPPATTLWEGSPAVPVQPSPTCFRFLHETCKAMKEVGADLWTANAVDLLKRGLRDLVAESIEHTILVQANGAVQADHLNGDQAAESEDEGEAEAEAAPPKPTEDSKHQQAAIQTFFDLQYLQKILHASHEETFTSFDTLSNRLREKASLEENSVERIGKGANDYYKRTFVLFGLLLAV